MRMLVGVSWAIDFYDGKKSSFIILYVIKMREKSLNKMKRDVSNSIIHVMVGT